DLSCSILELPRRIGENCRKPSVLDKGKEVVSGRGRHHPTAPVPHADSLQVTRSMASLGRDLSIGTNQEQVPFLRYPPPPTPATPRKSPDPPSAPRARGLRRCAPSRSAPASRIHCARARAGARAGRRPN